MTNSTLDLRTATLDDMVFEGRNKAYGAFLLRRLYNQHLARASATAIVLSLLFISSPLAFRYLFPPMVVAPDVFVLPDPGVVLIDPPVIEHREVEPVKQVAVTVRPPQATTPTKVVKDELAKPEIAKPEIKEVGPVVDEVGPTGPVAIAGSETGSLIGSPTGTKDSGSTKTTGPPKPFITAEVMPQFVGGQEALMRYMQKNLRYPPQALRNNVDGRVFISFTVLASGDIADVQVLKGLGYGTDEEATRVVKNMPAWVPGQQNNRSVAVRYTLPITFRYE
ncbi:energy transducer TonB [Hymenobacter yonginensis]|uniref:TonB family protein n=1 Tax=Hymenobacter yonginensis TaxID=748197 RepID=A0ABY7PMR5_9BACT|nr:energy transducer TonB [Hymenobacter yonginensis]WBO84543.1 TonB family protein [Hymenobacter yonginensis]